MDESPLDESFGRIERTGLEILLTDYRVASEDARQRDQLLHYTYYVAVAIVGLIPNAGWRLAAELPDQFRFLVPYGLVSAFLLGVLLIWSESFREARNACWARRDEIETYLDSIQPGLLRTNHSITNRLGFEPYEYGERNVYTRRQAGTYARYFLLCGVIVFALVALVGLASVTLPLLDSPGRAVSSTGRRLTRCWFPKTVDDEGIEVHYTKDVLEVRLPVETGVPVTGREIEVEA